MILKDNMNTKKQDWLTDYLINHNFSVPNTEELQERISGMTAQQIIEAMESAKQIQDRLSSTSLGKELN